MAYEAPLLRCLTSCTVPNVPVPTTRSTSKSASVARPMRACAALCGSCEADAASNGTVDSGRPGVGDAACCCCCCNSGGGGGELALKTASCDDETERRYEPMPGAAVGEPVGAAVRPVSLEAARAMVWCG